MDSLIVASATAHPSRCVKRIRALASAHPMSSAINVTDVNHTHLLSINSSAANCVTVIQWVYKTTIFNVTCIMAHARMYLPLIGCFPFFVFVWVIKFSILQFKNRCRANIEGNHCDHCIDGFYGKHLI